MAKTGKNHDDQYDIEELFGLSTEEQANKFVNFYATTHSSFKPVKADDFSHIMNDGRQTVHSVLMSPQK